MGDADGRVHDGIETPRSKNLVVRCCGGLQNKWRDAVQCKREGTADVAEESSRNPPQAGTQQDSRKGKRKPQEVLCADNLVPEVVHGPANRFRHVCCSVPAGTPPVRDPHARDVGAEGEAGCAVGERSVTLHIAAGGEVAVDRRGLLPHLPSAQGIAVVAFRQGGSADHEDRLCEEY